MKKHPHIEIIICDREDALVMLNYAVRMDVLHKQIAQRPFPAPHTILDMVGRAFPEMPQKHVIACAQHIKGYIAQQDAIANRINN